MENTQDSAKVAGLPPALQLFEIATGFMKSQALYAAARLGIADLLKSAPKTIDELAESTRTDRESLYRLMRALSGMGVFMEKGGGIFENTALSSAMRGDISISLRPYILLLGDKSWWNSWGSLHHSIKTGDSAFDCLFGMTYSEYLEKNADLSEVFNDCMTSVARVNNPAIVSAYDFSKFHKAADVGGGHGSLLEAVLTANPELHGILFDQPHVIKSFKGFDSQLGKRCEIKGGDFFKEIPMGADLYILKQIIHDWDDKSAMTILRNCHKAMPDNGRILIIEAVINSDNAQVINSLFDLHMLVTASGGKERTEPEFKTLLNSAGFDMSGIIQTQTSFCIIEGQKRERC